MQWTKISTETDGQMYENWLVGPMPTTSQSALGDTDSMGSVTA